MQLALLLHFSDSFTLESWCPYHANFLLLKRTWNADQSLIDEEIVDAHHGDEEGGRKWGMMSFRASDGASRVYHLERARVESQCRCFVGIEEATSPLSEYQVSAHFPIPDSASLRSRVVYAYECGDTSHEYGTARSWS